MSPVLGSDQFRAKAERHARADARETPQARRVRAEVPLARIVSVVAEAFGVATSQLLSGKRPSGEITLARNVALWRGQVEGRMTLSALAAAFGLGHYTSVATAITRARREFDESRSVRARVELIIERLNGNT